MTKTTKVVLGIVTGLLVLAVLLVAWNAQAVTLSPEQRAAIRANQVTSVIVTDVTSPPNLLASSCRTVGKTITGYNNVGVAMWTFTGSAYWCYDGKVVKSVTWNQSGRVTGVLGNLWRYDGVSSDVRSGKVGTSWVYRRVTGQFHYCVTWYCQYAYPYVSITVRGDGTSTTGGSS